MPSRLLAGAGALGAGAIVALACATTTTVLPHAGSRTDDGTGFLARISRGQSLTPLACEGEDCVDTYGDVYGGLYGEAAYGGDVYAMLGANEDPPAVNPVAGYTVTNLTEGGVIEGIVTWKSAPGVPSTITACGESVPNPTLVKDSAGGVRDAVVYLVDASAGKAAETVGGTLQIASCALHPHVQIAGPIGATLSVENDDDRARAIDLRAPGRKQTLSLAPRRQQQVAMLKDGFYEASGDAGGWVVVPRHPYYTVTDAEGRFRLDNVPTGEYTLAVWHEPPVVAVDGTRGKPVELHTRVKVVANQVTTQIIDLK